MIERDHRGQPQHAQAADEKHRDQRRHADVAAAAQRAGKHLDADVGQVDRRQHVHHLHAHRHYAVILRKYAEKRLGPQIKADTDQQRQPGGHAHADPHALFDAVVLARAEVLPHKGGDGNAQ